MKRYWMPDKAVTVCTLCMVRFSVRVRKHHCRLCGQIFCNDCCSANIPGEVVNQSGYVRACTACAELVQDQYPGTRSEESMVAKALTEDNEVGELIVPVSESASVCPSPTTTGPVNQTPPCPPAIYIYDGQSVCDIMASIQAESGSCGYLVANNMQKTYIMSRIRDASLGPQCSTEMQLLGSVFCIVEHGVC